MVDGGVLCWTLNSGLSRLVYWRMCKVCVCVWDDGGIFGWTLSSGLRRFVYRWGRGGVECVCVCVCVCDLAFV